MIRIDQHGFVRWPLVKGLAALHRPAGRELSSTEPAAWNEGGPPTALARAADDDPRAAATPVVLPSAEGGGPAAGRATARPGEAWRPDGVMFDPLPPHVYLPSRRPPLRIVTFGGFAVWQAGVCLGPGVLRPKARTLLAALLCARGPVHRNTLLAWLWGRLPAGRAVHALRTTVYELRRALEPPPGRGRGPSVIVMEDQTYRLALGDMDHWDAATFLALAEEEAASGSPEERLRILQAAEACSSGEFLPDWPDAPWAEALRAKVGEVRRDILASLGEALKAAGRLREAARRYRELADRQPECEEWHRALMRLYFELGERGLALRQYQACREALARLHAEPSPSTVVLSIELAGGGAVGPGAGGAAVVPGTTT